MNLCQLKGSNKDCLLIVMMRGSEGYSEPHIKGILKPLNIKTNLNISFCKQLDDELCQSLNIDRFDLDPQFVWQRGITYLSSLDGKNKHFTRKI